MLDLVLSEGLYHPAGHNIPEEYFPENPRHLEIVKQAAGVIIPSPRLG